MEEPPREGCYLIWLRRLLDKIKGLLCEESKTTLGEGCYLIWLRRLLDKGKNQLKQKKRQNP
jgi:hypothetical protein